MFIRYIVSIAPRFHSLLFPILIIAGISAKGQNSESGISDQPTLAQKTSVLVIPYMPAMHLSDSDPHIAEGSERDIGQIREDLRLGLVRCLDKKFAEVYDVKMPAEDFVQGDQRDLSVVYHSLAFFQDSTYPSKYPVKDTSMTKKKFFRKSDPAAKPLDTKYINVFVRDPALIPDYAKKYDCDYVIFLNELDINTHAEDCLNLALMIYNRDLKVHYSIFDKTGKQVYGDVAVSFFPSNSNDVNEIVDKNFPSISTHILESMKRLK